MVDTQSSQRFILCFFPVDCTCKISIPLTSDTDSHGCNGGWVGQLGMPAMATVESSCGHFEGFQSMLNNGDQLGTFVIDGTFAGGWVNQLKWTATFDTDASWQTTPTGTKWGIVTYGDCTGGPAFGFHVEKTNSGTSLMITLELMSDAGLQKHELDIDIVSK